MDDGHAITPRPRLTPRGGALKMSEHAGSTMGTAEEREGANHRESPRQLLPHELVPGAMTLRRGAIIKPDIKRGCSHVILSGRHFCRNALLKDIVSGPTK